MTKRNATNTTAAKQAPPTPDAPPVADVPPLREISTKAEGGDAPAASETKPPSKTHLLVQLLRQPGGTTIETMMQATGWQAHSVRGALSGAVKKGLGLPVTSQTTEAGRIYSLPVSKAAGGDAS